MKQKITIPLFCYTFLFAITTALVTINSINPTLLFFVTIISACMFGMLGAVLSGGLFSLGALFPPAYTGALMNGQGLAGIIVSVSALITTLSAAAVDTCSDDDDGGNDCPQKINFSALAYFIIATLVLLTCMLSFSVLKKLYFTRYYLARANAEKLESVGSYQEYNPTEQLEALNPILSNHSGIEPRQLNFSRESTLQYAERNNHPADNQSTHSDSSIVTKELVWLVLKKVRVPAFSVMFTFVVTIAVFPSLTVLMESTQKCHPSATRFSNDIFTPFLFLLFNIFDFCGRVSAGVKNIFTVNNLWIASLARLITWPLFLLCNISNSQLPAVFNNDAFPILFMIFMAFSNGYVASVSMMMGPTAVAPKEQALAGTIMIFSLTLGLLLGSSSSFLIVYISQGHL